MYEIVPSEPGEEKRIHHMKVYRNGDYLDSKSDHIDKPQIILNGKWLVEAEFDVGDWIEVSERKNELVIRRLSMDQH